MEYEDMTNFQKYSNDLKCKTIDGRKLEKQNYRKIH